MSVSCSRCGRRIIVSLAAVAMLVSALTRAAAQDEAPHERRFTVKAKACAYTPARIEVDRGDVVRIEFVAEGAPYSFVIDGYRIAKRATPGHSVTFGFLATQAGTFDFYSDVALENGCGDVRGTLIVRDLSRRSMR
jgi:plastocyanin